MKAFIYGANGAEITDVAKPAPKGTQVLVRVRANGLNRADLGMTKGHAHGAAGGDEPKRGRARYYSSHATRFVAGDMPH